MKSFKIPGASHWDFYRGGGGGSKHVKNQSTRCEASNPSHFQNCVPTWPSFHRPRSGNTGWVVVLFKIQIRYITHLSVFISITVVDPYYSILFILSISFILSIPFIPSILHGNICHPFHPHPKVEKLQEPSLSMCQDHKVETIPCLRKDLAVTPKHHPRWIH